MRFEILPAALAEMQEGAAFYRERAGVELQTSFVSEYQRVANLVLANPGIGKAVDSGLRRFLMNRFPYTVIYRAKADQLLVVAVAHQNRSPGYWLDRV